jgi:hypothetical protein
VLTYVLCKLTDFQAHRDAFIQNYRDNTMYVLKQDLMFLVKRYAKGGKIAAVEMSFGAHALNHRQA